LNKIMHDTIHEELISRTMTFRVSM
jgi:hypothetical protein